MHDAEHLRATRAAYDTVAADYAEILRTELDAEPLDRALLNTFAELVLATGGGPVADLGCGPGRVTTYLHALGLDAFGVDLSPEMIALARASHPDLQFDLGSLLALDIADGALGGAVAWYSIIHTPPAEQPALFAELARVLTPGGRLLLAFQAGADACVHLEHAYGHDLALDAYRLDPERVAAQLHAHGLVVHTRVVREPEPRETTPQAYLFAQKGGGPR